MKRILLTLAVVFLVVPLLLFVTAVVYYHFDSPLSAQVRQVLAGSPRPKPEDNAYLYLLGMHVAKGGSPYRKGLEVARLAKKYQSEKGFSILTEKQFPGAFALLPTKGFPSVDEKGGLCLQYAKSHPKATQHIVKENALLLTRLRELYAMPAYYETGSQQSSMLATSHLLSLQAISLADIAARWESRQRQAALKLLQQDLHFWRMVLRSNTSLFTHMLALAIVHRDLALFSAMLSDRPDSAAVKRDVSGLLQAFSKEELSLRRPMQFTFRDMYEDIQREFVREQKKSNRSFMDDLFFKRRDFYNRSYASDEKFVDLSECDMQGLARCIRDLTAVDNRPLDYFSLDFLANPAGDILVRIAEPAYRSFALAGFRLELYRRLLLIKYAIYSHHVTKTRVGQYLDTLPSHLTRPVAGTRVQWQAGTQSLLLRLPRVIGQTLRVAVP